MGELPHHHEDRKRLERLRSFIQEPESFQEVANLCRLLSDNSRVRIFWLLCHCEECVMNLSTLVGMSSPAASHHLRQLKDSGLIVSRRVGKEVYYRAADTEVAQLLHQIIERTVEVTCPQSDSQLARQFLMNPSTMKELFKEVYGSSIAAHIRQHRMERASALLLESDDSVAQVARTVGYESQSKFTSEFKKAFSMLPTEYRRLHKQA